ncbi:2-C-methyl-D-erythritol 2,4-cyclodiphosphate synthase [Chloroflexota bacterium]
MRVGIGYDIHPLKSGRRLVLGGIEIPFDKGLDGWSDADFLTHAIIDALLGAAGLEDIGCYFPPGEPHYKDISSLVMLERMNGELAEHNWRVSNVDATIVAEQPRLGDFINQMRKRISDTLGITPEQVSVKASTSNGLGLISRGEGIAALAIAAIESIAD